MLSLGQEIPFSLDGYESQVFTGLITYISPVIDSASQTIKVRLSVENTIGEGEPGRLKLGRKALLACADEVASECPAPGGAAEVESVAVPGEISCPITGEEVDPLTERAEAKTGIHARSGVEE